MKDLFQKYVSTRRERTITGRNVGKIDKENGFHWSENPFSLIVMQYLFKHMLPLDRKIKVSVAEKSGDGKKKFPLAGVRLFFRN